MTSTARTSTAARDWNALIADVVAGRWVDPGTGKSAAVSPRAIILADSLDGGEADLLAPLEIGERPVIVADENTFEALGRRVAGALGPAATEHVMPARVHPDEATVAALRAETAGASALVAVGSGSLTDTCKYAAHLDGKPLVTFGTAASMNGYAAETASITLKSGLKASLPATAPRGIFLDLDVSARAPAWLSAAGLGDSLCRSTAQTDWWMSHRLLGTAYSKTPYRLQEGDEPSMLALAEGLGVGDIEAVGVLHRVLTLCGLGVCYTGTSHHGSMGEHLISHWIDMFAGDRHPGTTHGQQVGIASLAMARLQARILARETPPRVGPDEIDEAGLRDRYGRELADLCIAERRAKALDEDGARVFNETLERLWPSLRAECAAFALPVAGMEATLASAQGPTTARQLGLDRDTWAGALRGARDIRGRWSFLDLAAGCGMLEAFIEDELALSGA